MHTVVCEEETSCMADECDVVMANSNALLDEVFRLRYQVYCVEKGYERGHAGRERDAFDARARHALLIHRQSGQPVGTVRVVPPVPQAGLGSLPMADVCDSKLMHHLPARTTGEISRFAISKKRRFSCHAGTMVRLGLMQGIVRASSELGLTNWCAIMEPVLLRLLQVSAIHFRPMGSPIEHHGLRQPSYAGIGEVLDRIRAEQPKTWRYITLGGQLWYPSQSTLLVA